MPPPPHPRYMPRPSPRLYHPHNIGWGVEIVELFIMKFSPLPCYLVPLIEISYLPNWMVVYN
jgi:hypothetical protein